MAEPLWVCHGCRLIGSGFQAGRHVDRTGHEVEQLTQAESDAVLEEARRGWPRASDFIAYAEFKRKVEASG